MAMLTANGCGRRGLGLLALSGPAPDESPTLAGLEKRIASAHGIYQRGEYQRVADGLPALISSTTSGTVLAENERSRQRVLAAQGWSFVLAAKLATKFADAPTARLAADRAVTAATYSASPVCRGRPPTSWPAPSRLVANGPTPNRLLSSVPITWPR